MLDIKLIRKNPDFIKTELSKRNESYVSILDKLLSLDSEKKEKQVLLESLQAERNSLSKSVKSKEDSEKIKTQVIEINSQIALINSSYNELEEKISRVLLELPNLPSQDTPIGSDENNNIQIKTWGKIPELSQVKTHFEIAEELNLIDFENTSNISGTRFSSFTGDGAKLQRALINFMLDEASNAGYFEISPPVLVKSQSLRGTGQLPKFEEDLYKIQDCDLYLVPTAEVPLTGFFASENISSQDLPKKLCAYTTCFRKEAGSAGKDTRGIIRQHQFDKIELVHLCAPENSKEEHEKLVSHAESILEKLELPYRRVQLCSGDLGFSAQKCYDLEVWFPSQKTYREISSCSNCGDFQARRLNFKFKKNSQSKAEFIHTLNGSGLAVGRCLAAILENYLEIQTQDNNINKLKIKIPKALVKYMHKEYI